MKQPPLVRDDVAVSRTHDRLPLTARMARAALGHPTPFLAVLGAGGEVWCDGRRLHPAMQLLCALAERTERGGDDPEARRREMRNLVRLSSPVIGGVRVVDRTIAGRSGPIPVRIYRPYGAGDDLPALLYAHGGGFVVGDLDTHDPTCRLLARRARAVVVAVHYRLAPEHPFPAAVDDVVDAYIWVRDHPTELGAIQGVVGAMGDSAGGTLAAVLCLEARRLDLPQPTVQCPVYPLTDMRLEAPSYDTFATGFSLTREGIEWFRDRYTPDPATWDDPRVSPLRAGDLDGLAPTLVVTAGFDPLRDDGTAWVEALRDAGVAAVERCFDDMIHGFHAMLALPDAADAAAEVDDRVGHLLRHPPRA